MNSAAIFKFKNTVFIRLNAAAFIKFLAFPMRCLFRNHFFKINFKSFVIIIQFMGSSVSFSLLR